MSATFEGVAVAVPRFADLGASQSYAALFGFSRHRRRVAAFEANIEERFKTALSNP